MSILGIDYGAKKIGLAKSDEAEKMALPLETLIGKSRQEVLLYLKNICRDFDVKKIVVGIPISMKKNNEPDIFLRQKDLQNKQMQEVLEFIDWLRKNIDIPVETEDERLSTKMANGLRRDLVKKGPDDAVAAMLILQSYLDKIINNK
jgi:putative Holliday junction resolvase